MPRIRKTGAVYPIRHEQRKTLKDGTVKTYVNWQAKVDGRWVSAKTYKECDRKIAEALKEKTEWGMGVDRATRLGEYAERWFELKRRDLKPKSINNYASLISVHLCKYANEKLRSDRLGGAAHDSQHAQPRRHPMLVQPAAWLLQHP